MVGRMTDVIQSLAILACAVSLTLSVRWLVKTIKIQSDRISDLESQSQNFDMTGFDLYAAEKYGGLREKEDGHDG
jgi:hypothetical protein